MLKHASIFCLCIAAIVVLSVPAWSGQIAVTRSSGLQIKAFTFDGKEALAGWAITGDVAIGIKMSFCACLL